MQSLHRRKRKATSLYSYFFCFRWRALLLHIFLFWAFFFFFDGFPFGSHVFRQLLTICWLSPLSAVRSSGSVEDSASELFHLKVEDQVVFPDHVLLFVSKRTIHLYRGDGGGFDYCVYFKQLSNSSDRIWEKKGSMVLTVDDYDEFRSIARCSLPEANYSTLVNLQKQDRIDESLMVDRPVHSWETLAYAAVPDANTSLVFVKGLNLRPGRVSDPSQFICHFNWGDSKTGSKFALTTRAVSAAQEVVRCLLPLGLRRYPDQAHGVRVSVGVTSNHIHGAAKPPLPSVANLFLSTFEERNNKYELCVCTMVWNQASSLREWIVYHAWLGVERWFIYDNNSDDNIKEVVEELEQENYNVSRHVWPWIKTQEAGFSHCALKARNECKWVAFMDVDEFFYFLFPTARKQKRLEFGYPGRHSLRSLVANFSSSNTIGEIRTVCHSFGPSGLSKPPSQGVTGGYTCRLQRPERHKSIVRLEALHKTLLNVVHHFHLRKGYRYQNMPQKRVVINHYKYQVWDAFRAKFFLRVATYVSNWQENQNEGSQDRVPGLGTEAVEPPNWAFQFCEVWDTGLRDFVMVNLADPASGMLPWDKSLL